MPAAKAEKIFFYFFLILFLSPLLLIRYFPSTDGPAHLYNATLIKNLLLDQNGIASKYFEFNTSPQPNWSAHAVMALLQNFFPAWLSQKFFLLIYFIALAFSFRAVVLQLNPKAGIATCLILPFIPNFIFYIGFYNFLLSLPLIFILCWYWNYSSRFSLKRILWLALLFLAIYFSHILSFAVSVICIGIIILYASDKKSLFKEMGFVFCSSIPCLILTLFFFSSNKMTGYKGTVDYLPTTELISYLTDARPLICYTHEEKNLSQFVFYIFCLLFFVVFLHHIFQFQKEKNLFHNADAWLLLSMVMITLLFAVPDNIASGGFVSIRFCLLAYLFFVLWLTATDSYSWIKNAAVVIVLLICLKLTYNRFETTRLLSDEVKKLEQASEFIKEGSVVLPLNYSQNWTTTNLLNYIGCFRNVAVLDNYEANYNQFPLKWKPNADPSLYFKDWGKSSQPCIDISNYESRRKQLINYVVTFQRDHSSTDLCDLKTMQEIDKYFIKIFEDETKLVEVYQRK